MYTCWQQYLKKGRTLIEILKKLFYFLFYKKHFLPPFLVVWTVLIIPWNTFEQSKNLSFFFQFCLMFVSLVVVIFKSSIPKNRRFRPRARQSFHFQKNTGTLKINIFFWKSAKTFLINQRTKSKKKIRNLNF